jgi:hypothetical protein
MGPVLAGFVLSTVMPALVAGIHVFGHCTKEGPAMTAEKHRPLKGDGRDIGVRKHAVLRTAVPAHDAAVRHCLSTVMPRACRGLSSFRDGPMGRTRNPDARHRVRFWIPGSLAAARAPE